MSRFVFCSIIASSLCFLTPKSVYADQCSYEHYNNGDIKELIYYYSDYETLFSGGNHFHNLESASASLDYYRALRGLPDLQYREISEGWNVDVDPWQSVQPEDFDSFKWVLEEFQNYDAEFYWRALVNADWNTLTELSSREWKSKDEVGDRFLGWLDAAVKASRVPWNFYPYYASRQENLWNDVFSAHLPKLLAEFRDSNYSLEWYAVIAEFAHPAFLPDEIKTKFNYLEQVVSSCKASEAEYFAWAITSRKFKPDSISNIERKFLNVVLLESKYWAIARSLLEKYRVGEIDELELKMRASELTFGEFSEVTSSYIFSIHPDFRELKIANGDYSLWSDISVNDIKNIIYYRDESLKTREHAKLLGILAGRLFAKGELDQANDVLKDLIELSTRGQMNWNELKHVLESYNVPAAVKTSILVLSLDDVTNWPDYLDNCEICISNRKDIPSSLLSDSSHDRALMQMYKDRMKLDRTRSIRGYYKGWIVDRAAYSNRPEIFEFKGWQPPTLEELKETLDTRDRYKQSLRTPLVSIASKNILDWVQSSCNLSKASQLDMMSAKVLDWFFDKNYVDDIHVCKDDKAAQLALESILYVSKWNAFKDANTHPPQKAFELLNRLFPDKSEYKYWYKFDPNPEVWKWDSRLIWNGQLQDY